MTLFDLIIISMVAMILVEFLAFRSQFSCVSKKEKEKMRGGKNDKV